MPRAWPSRVPRMPVVPHCLVRSSLSFLTCTDRATHRALLSSSDTLMPDSRSCSNCYEPSSGGHGCDRDVMLASGAPHA